MPKVPSQVKVALLFAVGALGIRWLTNSRRRRTRLQRRLPKRLVLIRHGQSEGNATSKTKAVYRSTPDHLIALTERGKTEARDTGKLLEALLTAQRPCGRAKFICSPHVRTRQTLEGVCYPLMVDDYMKIDQSRICRTMLRATRLNRSWSPFHPS